MYHKLCMGVRRFPAAFLFFGALLLVLAACSGSNSTSPGANGSPKAAPKQVLIFPNVGTTDIGYLDPASGPDANSGIVAGMVYSGLVRSDKNLNVIPDQATWDISNNNTVYTFHLKPGLTFSDGSPVTAQTYAYTLTRQLLPEVKSPVATFFEGNIVGANDVNTGKTKTLAGVKALDAQTLQIILTKPTPYFLEVLTNSLYFPLNESMISRYGQANWVNNAAGNAIGTGPFMIKEWDHNVKMILVPNPHYYGAKTQLTEVDMIFVNNPTTAFNSYRAGQYNFVWNISPSDQQVAQNVPGFIRTPLLQTDLLFFNNKMSPFNNATVRQAFAYATDRNTLVQAVLKNAVTPAPTIIPPGMPGYQPNYTGLPFDKAKAKSLLLSVFPDVSQVPSITFSYPSSQVSQNEAAALQQMWQNALGIQVKLNPVELNAYNQETANHLIQFGFTQWGADFPDPYDWLTLNLYSTAPNNNGNWNNHQFDQMVTQAEQTTGDARIALYNQAEQIAITDVGWLPIDHEATAAIIPSWVHGVTLNGEGLYFSDWSGVYLSQH